MSDKGIIFSPAMVRALLDGRKTQTRRLLAGAPEGDWHCDRGAVGWRWVAPAGAPSMPCKVPYLAGDRLYVREAHRLTDCTCTEACRLPGNVYYEAGDNTIRGERYMLNRLRPSIHMPRWASRLWLAVTDVRVQRLTDILEHEARAEGVERWKSACGTRWYRNYGDPEDAFENDLNGAARLSFSTLWGSLHTAEGTTWDANPWVVAVSFECHRGNIDAEAAHG